MTLDPSKRARKCQAKNCERIIRSNNKSGYCSSCGSKLRDIKYDKLRYGDSTNRCKTCTKFLKKNNKSGFCSSCATKKRDSGRCEVCNKKIGQHKSRMYYKLFKGRILCSVCTMSNMSRLRMLHYHKNKVSR